MKLCANVRLCKHQERPTMFIRSVSVALLAMASVYAQAAPGSFFGPLPEATYAGNGIPTDPSAVTRFNFDHSGTISEITLGLTAHQRYSNPALTSDPSGVFFATPGQNDGLTNPAKPLAATWNFGFYVNSSNEALGTIVGNRALVFELFYDTDPGPGTALADLGRIDLNAAILGAIALFAADPTAPGALDPTAKTIEGSENLDFDYLNDGVPGFVQEPVYLLGFDPLAIGVYSFVLRATDENNIEHQSAMLVDVRAPGTDIPEPGTLALLGLALAGMGVVRSRRVKA